MTHILCTTICPTNDLGTEIQPEVFLYRNRFEPLWRSKWTEHASLRVMDVYTEMLRTLHSSRCLKDPVACRETGLPTKVIGPGTSARAIRVDVRRDIPRPNFSRMGDRLAFVHWLVLWKNCAHPHWI